MSILLIPTAPSVPFQVFKTRLEGRDYVFHLSWNQREALWHLDINDDEDDPIRSGFTLMANWPLLRRLRWNVALPPGELAAIDLTTDGSPPGLDDFGPGQRVELTYWESTD